MSATEHQMVMAADAIAKHAGNEMKAVLAGQLRRTADKIETGEFKDLGTVDTLRTLARTFEATEFMP